MKHQYSSETSVNWVKHRCVSFVLWYSINLRPNHLPTTDSRPTTSCRPPYVVHPMPIALSRLFHAKRPTQLAFCVKGLLSEIMSPVTGLRFRMLIRLKAEDDQTCFDTDGMNNLGQMVTRLSFSGCQRWTSRCRSCHSSVHKLREFVENYRHLDSRRVSGWFRTARHVPQIRLIRGIRRIRGIQRGFQIC